MTRRERAPLIDTSDINAARSANIFEVAASLGYQIDKDDKGQFKGDGYRLAVKDDLFFDHEQQRGGRGAIDFVMQSQSVDFLNAVSIINNQNYSPSPVSSSENSHTSDFFTPTDFSFSDSKVKAKNYLVKKRGLDPDMINKYVKDGLIQQDNNGNVAFSYAGGGYELRGSSSKSFHGFKGEKGAGFVLDDKEYITKVVIVESSIDALSYKQLHPNEGSVVVALGGSDNKKAVDYALSRALEHNTPLYVATDNDAPGNKLYQSLSFTAYKHRAKIKRELPKEGFKDWNEQLKGDK